MSTDTLITQLAQAEQDIRRLKRELREQRELRLRLLGAIEYGQQKESPPEEEDA